MSGNAEVDWSGVPSAEVSGVASVYTFNVEHTVNFFSIDIKLSGSLHFGAVGIGAELDFENGKFKFTPPMLGTGSSYSIDFDIN